MMLIIKTFERWGVSPRSMAIFMHCRGTPFSKNQDVRGTIFSGSSNRIGALRVLLRCGADVCRPTACVFHRGVAFGRFGGGCFMLEAGLLDQRRVLADDRLGATSG